MMVIYREKGSDLMCELFEGLRLDAKLEGELDGSIRTYIESGREFKVAEADIPNKVMVKF